MIILTSQQFIKGIAFQRFNFSQSIYLIRQRKSCEFISLDKEKVVRGFCFNGLLLLFIGGSVTAGLAIYDTMQVGMCWRCTIYFYLDKRENYFVTDYYYESKILTSSF